MIQNGNIITIGVEGVEPWSMQSTCLNTNNARAYRLINSIDVELHFLITITVKTRMNLNKRYKITIVFNRI